MDTIKPITVGRNAPLVSQVTPALQAPEQVVLPLNQPVMTFPTLPLEVPVQPVFQPVQPAAPVVAQTAQTGVNMFFSLKKVTRIVLELPWPFISERLECAFVSNTGELVVCDIPPMYDKTNNTFVLRDGTEALVLGRVMGDEAQYWRESVTFRPESGYSESDVKDAAEVAAEPVHVEVHAPELVDAVDYSHMSRNQKKKLRSKLMSQGTAYEDIPAGLKD